MPQLQFEKFVVLRSGVDGALMTNQGMYELIYEFIISFMVMSLGLAEHHIFSCQQQR